MKRSSFLAGVLVALSVHASAEPPPLPWKDAAPAPELPEQFRDIVMPPVVLAIPGMDKVRYVRDLDYRPGAEPQVKLDLYLPPSPAAPAPIVLFVHGGTDLRGRPKDWGIFQSWGRIAAASGMAGVTFTHHLGFPKTQIREGAADVAAAIDFVRSHASEYGLDGGRICIVAFSAGGPMLAPYMVNPPGWLKCLVGWYPFMDIRQTREHAASEAAATLQQFSNILKVQEEGPKTPLYLVRAGGDEIPTLRDSIDRFAAAALKSDYPLTLANHPAAPHGFDNRIDDLRTREIILGSLQFLSAHFGPASATDTAAAMLDFHSLESQRSAAIAAHDSAFLERLYADDFAGVTDGGAQVDKATLLARMARVDLRGNRFAPEQVTTVPLASGSIAVRGRLTGRDRTGAVIAQSYFLHVYEYRNGRWQLVTGQSTAVPKENFSK